MAAKRGSARTRIGGMLLRRSWPAQFPVVRRRILFAVLVQAIAAIAMRPVAAGQAGARGACRIEGRISSGSIPLPGVAIVLATGDTTLAATSTEPDGSFQMAVSGGTFRLQAELSGFGRLEREVVVGDGTCRQRLDLELTLLPRARTVPPAGARGARPGAAPPVRAPLQPFEALAVQEQAAAALAPLPDRETEETAARQLLPPGFSGEGPAQAVTFSGSAANLDRGMLGDRLEALARGEFDAATGDLPPGFGAAGAAQGMPGGFAGRAGGPGGRGGPGGGRGDFVLAGRGGRQDRYSGTATYTFGGSPLDATPYQLRPDSPGGRARYARQNFGVTFGGPVKIPGLYDGTRRTTFTVNYGGNRGDELFDQYATVPSAAMRSGDFSTARGQLYDPFTGTALAGNVIPEALLDPAAVALLRFIPDANLPGTTRNYHSTTTTDAMADTVSARVTHNFTPGARGAGRGFGGRGGAGGRGGGRGPQGTAVLLNAQLQYRRNDNERLNVFPTLGGHNTSASLAVPVSLNVAHRRSLHNISLNLSRTTGQSVNQYAGVEDVAGAAGIVGVSTDPFGWGVPDLSFSTFTNVRDLDASRRSDRRVSAGYTWSRPFARHTLRAGGDYRWDRSQNRTDPNARGAFVFTGLYASGGAAAARGDGLDFADFLLGLPQQATVQYGPGNVALTGRSMSLFFQDDWRPGAGLTFNLGVRYELLWPFVEEEGRMVNLDAAPGFDAVSPVLSGAAGPYSGAFPRALVQTDGNNVAPRLGVAWRVAPSTVLRGGYGVSFNSGSYSSIARQLVGQPPFAVANTALGTAGAPLSLADPLATASPDETTNSYGVQRDYALGVVQTWNVDLARDLRRVWNVSAGYTHTRGSSLDILRAPNRGAEGLRIDHVQPFLWQTSEGSSRLHAATFRARRRPVNGVGVGASYTLARSRDNASSLGGAGSIVAQDDQNLAAEWGLSSFDRRHHLSTDVVVELPFGENRPWLNGGGAWAALLENWRASASFVWQSGTPYTPRVTGSTADVARGTNGTLRADYSGDPIRLQDPTIDLFFNTAAFSLPEPGTFGDASRNLIVGPGSRQLNAQFARDVRFGGSRAVTVQLSATNLLNMVNFAAIDTVVNSPTFGQVLSVRPMRSMQLSLRFRF